MILYLADKNGLKKHVMPNKIEEAYILTYNVLNTNEEYTITIESKDNKWILKSNGIVDIIDNNNILNWAVLEQYNNYRLRLAGENELITLFCMPSQDSDIYNLNISNIDKLTIGNTSNCNIYYDNLLINKQIIMLKKDNKWCISSEEVSIYINNSKVTSKYLNNGDIIFIYGLKIIFMSTFLEINNPGNNIKVIGIEPYKKQYDNNSNIDIVNNDESIIDLYSDNDYFYHIPRIREKLSEEKITIDAPPGNQVNESLPFILSIGTSLTMGAFSIMNLVNVYTDISSGQKTFSQCLPMLIVSICMILGCLVFPRLTVRYQHKKQLKRENLRQVKYTKYLKEQQEKIKKIIAHEEEILNDNNLPTNKCLATIDNKDRNFWGRNIFDNDFLTVRLGIGVCDSKLEIEAPEKHFTLDEDNLLNNVYDTIENAKILKNIPITYSFLNNNISSIIFNCSYKKDYINNIMTQLLSLHSGVDLKIVIITDKPSNWDYMKIVPHCWNDEKNLRFFSTNESELNEISSYLIKEYKTRKEAKTDDILEIKQEDDKDKDTTKILYQKFSPYYFIITDDFNNIKNSSIINELMNSNTNYGFSLLTLSDTMKNSPNKCNNFIQIGEKDSYILKKEVSSEMQKPFYNEYVSNINMNSISIKLANIPLQAKDGVNELPDSLTFLDMFKVSKIDQLNIMNRWQVSNPVNSLSTDIGVHSNLEPFKLDLHEKVHGPHGLIAGSTGSGKSEFIITYILSMAINYHPYEVQFVLIDYKGGGLAGAFENPETGMRLPHLIGTITNLDTSEINRTLVSIQSELKRRQKVFNEVKALNGESTIDIYKYQKLYREGKVKEPMSHLFIISDEFAELKSQQPEFMSQLISIARIGRSLGVHLVLATQKPSGVVNDQIWSNSKFKVCLKVQDRSDSMEVLKKPDAASLKETGRFYLQVGYNDYFDIGQSAWSGARYIPTDKIQKKVDDDINFVNNIGYSYKIINDESQVLTSEDLGDQLTNIVKYICNLSKRENIITQRLWLDKVPDEIYVNNLKQKYNYNPTPYFINPMIGEYDNPSEQQQGLLNLNLTELGNTLIYGETGSGKENLLSTIIGSMSIEHSPEEVNIYIIDCGSEALQVFNKYPHVGCIATIDESDKIQEIFKTMDVELEHRKDLFVDYGGSYINYIKSSNKLPLKVVIINDYDNFKDEYGSIAEDAIALYRECFKYGIVFILTGNMSNSFTYRMTQNFNNKIALQLSDKNAYRDILDSPRGLYPAKVFGRGIVKKDDSSYEFQTAYVFKKDKLFDSFKSLSNKLCEIYPVSSPKIVILPERIGLNMVDLSNYDLTNVPIGYNAVTKKQVSYNFSNDHINLVLAQEMSLNMDFIYALTKEFIKIKNTSVKIIDFVNGFDKEIDGATKYNSNYDQLAGAILNSINQDEQSDKINLYLLIGVGAMRFRFSPEAKAIFNQILEKANTYNNTYFVIIDDYDNSKNLKVESWYQVQINNDNGLWVGPGVNLQMSINISNYNLEMSKNEFPYILYEINNSKISIVKSVIDYEGENINE